MVDVEDVVVLAPGPATPAAPAGTHAGDAAPVAVPTVLKALETLVPVSATVSMQTAAIRARTSAYSTSVAPRSRRAMRLGVAVGRGAITFGFGTQSERLQALVRTLSRHRGTRARRTRDMLNWRMCGSTRSPSAAPI